MEKTMNDKTDKTKTCRVSLQKLWASPKDFCRFYSQARRSNSPKDAVRIAFTSTKAKLN
jgi:hypothetical protein